MKPDPALAIDSINKSNDREWLRGFRARMVSAEETEIITAIDRRLAQLKELDFRKAIGSPLIGLALVQRVHEAVRVYEQFLALKHGGKRIRAARTSRMIKSGVKRKLCGER